MSEPERRIYLDHAATSWPKSDAVLEAMDRFARTCGAAAARGGYRSAAEADQIVAMTRRAIATLIGASHSDCISMHSNGTAALNAAIHGVVRTGDHVVTCAAEHNSVLRPLRHLELHHQIRLTVIPVDDSGRADAEQTIDAVTNETRLVALTHASNVTGAVQPVAEVGQALKNRSPILLCDAAQTFGAVSIDVSASGIDMLAAPGHKASGGPLGTGFLYVADELHDQIVPMVQGGTGSQSESLAMPSTMPSMMEAGNLNVPALAGWLEALRELTSSEMERRIQHARGLSERLYQGLDSLDHIRVFGCAGELPIASITVDDLSPTDASAVLDAEFGVETRAGMHCAALVHQFLGSSAEGTLRISAGHTSTDSDVDAVIQSLHSIVTTLHSA
jgi:cysteine desulfurase/selenocysteine lyase